MKIDIESQINKAIKDRSIIFTYLEKETLHTQEWRSRKAEISYNTRVISALRTKWRAINKS
jgi:hypothetical protein